MSSLPSLSTVLRGILPGSPPYKGNPRDASGHRASAGRGGGGGGGGMSTPVPPGGQPPSHQDLTLTPEATSQRPESSGGYRRTREEVDVMSEIESPGGGSVFSDNSCSTATYGAGGGGGSWGGSSWDGSDYEGGGPSSSDHEAAGVGVQQRGACGGASSAMGLGVMGGGATGAYGLSGCTSKRAKLTSRSLSRLSDGAVNGMGIGIMEGSRDMVGGGARGPGGVLVRSMSALDGGGQRGGRVFEQSMSHSTEEWRAMSKAGRVLGVDSLEERDVEDQRRASSVKAARILGVEDVAELQQSVAAARERQKWAPPRSSASKAARMLGVKHPHEAAAEEKEGRRGRKPTTKTTLRRSRSLTTRGAKGSSGSKPKPRQGITSLIRALEINGGSEATGSTTGSQNGSSENGDCSSLDYNGSEDLPRKKERGKQETGSNRSTRATESCSSVSDAAHTDDPDALSCHGGSSRGGSSVAEQQQADQEQQQKQQQQQQQHTRQLPELSDDSQLVGLQTPAHSSSNAAGPDGLRGFSRHTRCDNDDEMDMDIETPLSQPRSAALTSLRKAPAPLLAPYTPSLAPAASASASAAAAAPPSPEAGPAPSPSGSPALQHHHQQYQQRQQVARHTSDFAVGENGASWPLPSPSRSPSVADGKHEDGGGLMAAAGAEEKGSGRATRVNEVLDESPRVGGRDGRDSGGREDLHNGGGGWTRDWSRASAATVSPSPAQHQHRHHQVLLQQQQRPSSAPFDGRCPGGPNNGFRLPDPIPSCASSPSPWGPTADAAGCKDTRPDDWSEYKQESPVAPQQQLRGRDLPPAEVYADEKHGRWSNSGGLGLSPQMQQQQRQHRMPEFKHEPADVTLLSTGNGWEHQPAQPVGLVSSGAAGVYPYPHPQFRHHQFQQQHQQWQQQQQQHLHQQHAMAAAAPAGSFSPHGGYQDLQRRQHGSPSPSRVTMSPVVNGSGGGRDGSVAPGYGFPLANVGGSESSGDSDSMCDTFPDRMDEGDGPAAASSAFEALAALIPVVNPMGIARQQIQHPVGGGGGAAAGAGQLIKVEELGVDPAVAAAAAGEGRTKAPPKPRRRKGPAAPGNHGGLPVMHSPVASQHGRGFVKTPVRKNAVVASPSSASGSSGDDDCSGGGGGGISTRKQKEVATRPREKGRFVKRPPAFLPISAFKPASDRNEAAEAAEAAEEARQKADEAAAVAAAAAAAAAVQQRLETAAASASTSDTGKTNMMPPPPAVAVNGRGEKVSDGGGDGEVAPSSTVFDVGESEKDQDSHKAGSCTSSATTASTKPSTAAAASRRGAGGGGGGGATRGRGERRMASPPSRTAAPSNDIWFGEDSLAAQGGEADGIGGVEGNFNPNARDCSVSSDCGSERGSEGGGELRGMAFLPCSPMDRNSPGSGGGGGHGRSSSAWDSPSPRRNGSGSSGRRGSGSGGSSFMSTSMSMSSVSSCASSPSSMCSPPASGGALLSAPMLSDVPVVSGRGGGGVGRSTEKP